MTGGTLGLGASSSHLSTEPGSLGQHQSDVKAITSSSTTRKPSTSEAPSTSSHQIIQRHHPEHRKGGEIETISSRIGPSHESRIAIDEEVEERAIGSASDFSLLVPKGGPPSEPSSTTQCDQGNEDDEDEGRVKQYVTKSGAHVPLIEGRGKKGSRRRKGSSSSQKDGHKSRKGDGNKKKGGEKEVEKWESSTLTSGEKSGCNWYVFVCYFHSSSFHFHSVQSYVNSFLFCPHELV